MSFQAKRRVLSLDQAFLKKIKQEQHDLAPLVCVSWGHETQTCGHAVLRNLLSVALSFTTSPTSSLSVPVETQAGQPSPAAGAAASTSGRIAFVPTRPGHRQWLPGVDAVCQLVPAEGVKGLFSATDTPPSPPLTPSTLAADVTSAIGSAARGCVIISDLSALCRTLGGEAAPLSLLQVLRRKLPQCAILVGLNTTCVSKRTRDAITSLSTLFCECAAPLVPLPPALRGPGTPGGRLCLGEVQSTDRSLQTGKATQALHPFVVSPSTGRLDYAAGLAATTTGSKAAESSVSADEIEMRSVIAGSSMSLVRTQEEEQARKAVQLSYQHKGGLAAVKGGSASSAAASAAPVPKNLITLDIGDLDSDSDSESEEEV